MHFNVAQLLSGPVGAVRERQVSGGLDWADGLNRAVVSGPVQMMHTDRGILVRGTLCAIVNLECVRCLNQFEEKVSVALEEEYISAHQTSGRVERQALRADNLLIDSNNLLDLEPALKEYASLNSPLKPVCRPDCPGLCSRCGADLTQTGCLCVTAEGSEESGLSGLLAKYRTA
jgi:uncharacterized protein